MLNAAACKRSRMLSIPIAQCQFRQTMATYPVPSDDEGDPCAAGSSGSHEDGEHRPMFPSGFELAEVPQLHRIPSLMTFFSTVIYRSKADFMRAVIYYHWRMQRGFTINESDKRRYSAKCECSGHPFVMRFALSSTFRPPTRFQPTPAVSHRQLDHHGLPDACAMRSRPLKILTFALLFVPLDVACAITEAVSLVVTESMYPAQCRPFWFLKKRGRPTQKI